MEADAPERAIQGFERAIAFVPVDHVTRLEYFGLVHAARRDLAALRARVAELEGALREISSRRPKIPPDDDGYPDSGNADDARDYGYDRAYTACADIADRALTPEPRQ